MALHISQRNLPNKLATGKEGFKPAEKWHIEQEDLNVQ
jgi:hypothetical protein